MIKYIKTTFALGLLAAGLFGSALSPSAQALPLAPGTVLIPPLEPNPLGGTVLASQSVAFSSPGNFTGSLLSAVVDEGLLANPLGGYTFVYQLFNNGPNNLQRLTVDGFTGSLLDANYNPTPAATLTAVGFQLGGIVPSLFTRNSDPAGDVVGSSFFLTPILPNTFSTLLVFQTDRRTFDNTPANVIDGGTANPVAFGPVSAGIPDGGATAALLGCSFLGLTYVRSRFAVKK